MRESKSVSARLVIAVVAIVLFLPACGNSKRFDSGTWLKADARERGRMSEDLVKRRILVGSTIEQAKELLGEPQKNWGRVIQYDIDLGWLFKDPKHYGLQVHFDNDRTVREVKIVD